MTTLLEIDVPGLDLVLGGGIRVLKRVAGAAESATLLIRGPAGSGKTLFGTQLAASIARKLQTDVAYGCVELLPEELRAQHESIRGADVAEQVVPLGGEDAGSPQSETSSRYGRGGDLGPVAENVPRLDASFDSPQGGWVDPSREGEGATQSELAPVRIYAGTLDLGQEGQTVERLGGALEALLDVTRRRAGRPVRILVVDSLSDGYGLGSSAPRLLADGISKFAADEGLVVILLEETLDERPSVWSFAVDTVLELGWAEVSGRLQRKLWIPKNRLGPMVPGPHHLLISGGEGVKIHPHIEAYRRERVLQRLREPLIPAEVQQSWALKRLKEFEWLPPFRSCVTAVVGGDATAVRRLALGVGAGRLQKPLDELLGGDLFFRIGHTGGHEVPPMPSRQLGLSFLNDGASLLSMLREFLEALNGVGKSPRRIVVGDLRDLRYHTNAQDIVSALSVAAALLRELQIPLVLFDTLKVPGSSSVALSLADVSITWTKSTERLRVENLLTGQGTSVPGAPGDLILPE
jgi:KaiC/GvpD/RAD55 family RecA-like ATPase